MSSVMAAMLDELMGRNRNVAPGEEQRGIRWDDKSVCKFYLMGLCPHELFTNTRADLGSCSKIHDDGLKKEYNDAPEYKKRQYEDDFERMIESNLREVDRRISRNHDRLKMSRDHHSNPETMLTGGPNDEKIKMLSEKISALCEQAEQAGCQGNVEEAQGLTRLCDRLKDERQQLAYSQSHLPNLMDTALREEKMMEVCEICGSFLIIGDAQSRIDDHLMGKQHVGYARLRNSLAELKEKRQKRREEKERKRAEEEEEKKKQREDREKSRDKDKDKDRDKERDRGRRDRDRDRDGRRRSRSRDRRRSRSRDRGGRDRRRSRSRDKDRRDRSRDRKRDRSRSKDRRKDKRSRSRSRDRKRDKSQDRKDEKKEEKKEEKPKDELKQNGNHQKEDTPAAPPPPPSFEAKPPPFGAPPQPHGAPPQPYGAPPPPYGAPPQPYLAPPPPFGAHPPPFGAHPPRFGAPPPPFGAQPPPFGAKPPPEPKKDSDDDDDDDDNSRGNEFGIGSLLAMMRGGQ